MNSGLTRNVLNRRDVCEKENGHVSGFEWVLNVLTSRPFVLNKKLPKSK